MPTPTPISVLTVHAHCAHAIVHASVAISTANARLEASAIYDVVYKHAGNKHAGLIKAQAKQQDPTGACLRGSKLPAARALEYPCYTTSILATVSRVSLLPPAHMRTYTHAGEHHSPSVGFAWHVAGDILWAIKMMKNAPKGRNYACR